MVSMIRPNLLLIANHPQLTYLIKRYGERSGCRVISADRIETALDEARREQPAMLLLHLMSFSHDDWSMLRRLKTALGDDGIPITVIAAVADEKSAREEGATYWLWQPVMYADFMAALTATGVLPPRHTPAQGDTDGGDTR